MPADAAIWWLRTALGDLHTAQALLGDASLPSRASAQFAHQAAEKALKAAIAWSGVAPTRTHDLVYLAMRAGRDLELALARIDIVTLSAVLARSRYPTPDDPPIGPDDASRWVDDALQIVATCARRCKVTLESLTGA